MLLRLLSRENLALLAGGDTMSDDEDEFDSSDTSDSSEFLLGPARENPTLGAVPSLELSQKAVPEGTPDVNGNGTADHTLIGTLEGKHSVR